MREFDLDLLIGKKVAVNCKTQDEATEFIEYCKENGCATNVLGRYQFEITKIGFHITKDKIIEYFKISHYESHSFKVLSLIDLLMGKKEKPLNNFNDYGFEANFEGEILKQIGDILYGVVYVEYFGRSVVCEWNTKGKVISKYKIDEKAFELKPIKKEWYENPDNFPCIATKDGKNFAVIDSIDYLKRVCIYQHRVDFRPATKEEVLALLIEE